jgi:hypothetical protein
MKTRILSVAVVLVGLAPLAWGDPPDDAKKLLAELDQDVKAIDAKAKKETAERQEKALKALKELEDGYTKAGKKDEAVAVVSAMKMLKEEGVVAALGGSILADPGELEDFRGKDGMVFYFRVTGSTDGEVWGTGVYTDDSNLATAAVHAGLLKKGETGIVKVTIAAGQASYSGTTANDVTSEEYGEFEGSFKIEAVKAEKK